MSGYQHSANLPVILSSSLAIPDWKPVTAAMHAKGQASLHKACSMAVMPIKAPAMQKRLLAVRAAVQPAGISTSSALATRSSACSGRQRLSDPSRPLSRPLGVLQHSNGKRTARSSQQVHVWPFDAAWGTQIDGQSLASQLFAASLFPYLAFLYYLTRSGKTPRLALGGFWFLLVFVGATIPAGIYAKQHYGTSLANVDWLHGSAESLLTITNLLIVLGMRQGIRQAEADAAAKKAQVAAANNNGASGAGQEAKVTSSGGSAANDKDT